MGFKHVYIIFTLFFLGLIIVHPTFAADLSATGCTTPFGKNDNIVTLSCIGPLIINLLTWIFAFAGIVSLFFVIFGGFKFLTSGGEKEKVEEGRKTITWALIGLIVIFLSFAIVRLVGSITGVSCISSGSFEFGRCGLPENTCDAKTALKCPGESLPICVNQKWDCGDTACDPNEKIDCGTRDNGSKIPTTCDKTTGTWQCKL